MMELRTTAQNDEPVFTTCLKGRFPFRIGATSYVLPDALLPNARALSRCVDDIELVFFEMADLPDSSAIGELCDIAARDGVSYTVHMPLDLRLGSGGETERKRSVRECAQIASITSPLDPVAYIVHLNQGPESEVWLKALDRSMEELSVLSMPPEKLCIETLSYPLSEVDAIIRKHGLSVCMDTGHLLLEGISIEEFVDVYAGLIRVVHLHGVHDGRDHCHVGHMDRALLSGLLRRMTGSGPFTPDVATLEVFNAQDLAESLRVMKEYLKWAR